MIRDENIEIRISRKIESAVWSSSSEHDVSDDGTMITSYDSIVRK